MGKAQCLALVSLMLFVALSGVTEQGHAADARVVDLGSNERIRLVRLPQGAEVRIDGVLDEAHWARLPAWDEFKVIEPDTLVDPRHATIIRITYDDVGLYVGAEMHQPPETRIGRLSGRDGRALSRDSINLTLDTSGEGRYGFWFGVNLGDTLMDGTVLPERNFSIDWDGPWRGRSADTDYGWSAELFIPWATVSMPATGEIRRMGLYLSRKVAYVDERWGWPALPSTEPKFMSALQTIEMERVAPRQQYNLYPFIAIGNDSVEREQRYRVGADLFWRPSTNFQITATVNPDFGIVEADDVVINLSALEVFFPERRLFFVEGQEIFVASPRADTRGRGVGNSGAPYTLVNTRRIGGRPRRPPLPPGGVLPQREQQQLTELHGAAKATGQFGRFRYGLLGAFEDDVKFDGTTGDMPFRLHEQGSDYGIARLLYEDNPGGAYAALGILSTAVLNRYGDAHVTGVDGHWLTPDGKLKIDGQAMTSDVDDKGRGYGGFLDFEYTYRKGMVQRLGLEYFDEQIDINDLGFLQRNDHYRLRSAFVLTRSNIDWARDNQFDVRGFYQRSVSENRFTGGGIFLSNRTTFDNLTSLTGRLHFFPEQYDDLNSFGNGSYRIEERFETVLDWRSNPTRQWVFGAGGGWREEQLGDDTFHLQARVEWRPSDRFNAQLNLRVDDRGGWLLHQGADLMTSFEAMQLAPMLSAEYFISARQQLRVAFQWVGIRAREKAFFRIDPDPSDLRPVPKPGGPGARESYDFSVSQYSFQARYRWEFAPLSDVFLVYTRQADLGAALDDETFSDLLDAAWGTPLQNILVFKFRYRLGS